MHGAETVARGLLRVRCDGGKGQDGSGKKDAGLHRLLTRYREFDGGRLPRALLATSTMVACWTKSKTKPRAVCARMARAVTGRAPSNGRSRRIFLVAAPSS